MKANQLREFREAGIVAGVILKGGSDYLEIDNSGFLALPADVKPAGFHLVLAAKKGGRTLIAQKDVGKEGGGYHRQALSTMEGFAPGFVAEIMRDPIEVEVRGGVLATGWHKAVSNRLDCFCLAENGEFGLFQAGVVIREGRARLLGEWRWRGELRQGQSGLVGIPEHQKWGSFEGGTSNRTKIFGNPSFMALVKGANLKEWDGKPEEIDPPLPAVTVRKHARVQWYIVFAGNDGQGPCNLHPQDRAGKWATGWIHKTDIIGVKPDDDGEVRLWRGDLVSYEELVSGWGSKKDGPPKLVGVRLVERP